MLLCRIIAESAHSAYDKAAEYFNIKVRRVPVNKEFLADVKGFKRCINGNTIMVSFCMFLSHNGPRCPCSPVNSNCSVVFVLLLCNCMVLTFIFHWEVFHLLICVFIYNVP